MILVFLRQSAETGEAMQRKTWSRNASCL